MCKEKYETREGKKKMREKRKRKENAHRKGGGKNRKLTFLLSVGIKQKILKLTFYAMNCLMKHNNLSC